MLPEIFKVIDLMSCQNTCNISTTCVATNFAHKITHCDPNADRNNSYLTIR